MLFVYLVVSHGIIDNDDVMLAKFIQYPILKTSILPVSYLQAVGYSHKVILCVMNAQVPCS